MGDRQCCNDQMQDERPFAVRVECYAGHRGEQTPRALIPGDRRIATGVTWVDGELWHAASEGDESELRRIDRGDGEVVESRIAKA